MLESVVADLLNRFLGDYVENLDRSQLKLGIWGGNVALENLQIRENALSELDVPFKVKVGQIDKLILKIPWKNLYGEAVVATLEGLYLLVVPGASIKYDAEKEEKQLQEAKQRELLRIEEAMQKAAEKDKPKEEKKDTFIEKLAAQVIKNLQIKITNIHIRYEDDITDSTIPVSVGVTLGELSLQTSNEAWVPCVLNEAAKTIYKLVRLHCFSTYWNVNSTMFYHKSRDDILRKLKNGVMPSERKPEDFQYIFQPVSASAKLYINPEAELEQRTPKIDWCMEVQHIAIELTKPQYLSMIDMLESVDYMVRNAPYRKYRPEVSLQEDTRQWWNYAIKSILDVHVKRRAHMWCWTNIVEHRLNLKNYKTAFKKKLTQSKVPEETLKQLQSLEKSLDVFNIVLARQQAQAEVVRSGQKLLAKKSSQTGEKKSGGWFGGFWSKKEVAKKEDSDELSVPEKIEDLMTPEEKTKLFTAIGYSESSHNLTLPKRYVAHILCFKLLSTTITIRENIHTPETLKVQIIDLSTSIFQRPGAQAIKIEAKLERWFVTGLRQQNIVPSLITSVDSNKSSLLKIQFETNPEDSTADQVLILQSQPVEIIYDAITINALAEFFQTNKGMDLEQLTSATLMKLEEIKERTAAGLSHIIETRKVLDLRINLQPSFLLLPKSGFYHEKTDLIIVDFGSFQLSSIDQGAHRSANFSSLEELMDKAYDKFNVQIKNIHILFGRAGEDWKKARFMTSSSLHILQPLDIGVQLSKAMVERDRRMPRFKVSGELPLLHVKISDQKIQGVFELLDSIPLPKTSSTPSKEHKKVPAMSILARRPETIFKQDIGKSLLLDSDSDEYFDLDDDVSSPVRPEPVHQEIVARPETETSTETDGEELTNLHLTFEVKEVTLEFTKQRGKQEDRILMFSIQQLGTEACMKTYDLTAVSYLKKINLDYYDINDFSKQPLHLISSSDKQGLDLLKLEFIKAEKNGPDFQTTFGSTEQTLKVAFSSVELLLHSQALLSAISFLTEAIPSLPDKADKSPTQEQQDRGTFVKKAAKVSKDKDVFFFKLFAKLDSFRVNVCDGDRQITEIIIQGLDSSVSIQMNQIQAFARLRDIIVNDVNPETIHKKAVSIMEDEVFNFNLTLYPDATQGEAYKDVSKVDGEVSLRVGCIQIVFLHKFLMSLLSFLNNFQATKERVSVATAQAAHRAANSVKGLSERSFRLLMDIHLKAPVIVIPQSSVSLNAIVADLGLLRIHNEFSLVASSEDQQLPPVIDKMSVQLTELKLSRTVLHSDASRSDIQILHPIDLNLSVHRNLAAAWYHQIPAMEMKGHLNTMEVGLSQEDISVLLNVLVENLGEAEGDVKIEKQIEITKSKEETLGVQKPVENIMGDYTSETTKDARDSTALNLLLNFEIKEVVVRLMRQGGLDISPFHVLHVSQLGTEARVGNHEINASVYLRKITMICNEFSGPNGGPLHLINSSDETGDHLLKMEYIKADRNGPNFKAFHKNTEQTLSVTMSTLDLILHTQALLSLIDFLSSAIPSSGEQAPKRAQEARLQTEKQKFAVIRPDSATLAEEDIFNLKLSARLNAFNVFVCDELCKIADIRIQGMDASIAVQTRQTEVFARLRDIVVIDVDPKTIHQKAVFIVGDEVFSFKMLLYPEATEGASYTDMSVVDGKISLKVGCIHIVYLHKFLMSLLNFLNKFQAAKEALSTATAQAAEKAATSMKEFAQKSFRLSMDIDLKAPVIIIPQSSTSTNAIVADLGLIQVQNKFSLVPEENCPLPPVIDEMNIQLTQLQLSRTVLQSGSELPVLELLKPVNLLVSVKRNLAASWYPQIPAMQIVGDLKPMQLALSQEDLTILMSVLFENLSELPSLPSEKQPPEVFEKVKKTTVQSDSKEIKEADRSEPMSEEDMGDDAPAVTLKFEFNFQSLSIVLYSNDNSQEAPHWQHSDSMRLGEMRLHLLTSSGRMFADGSMDVSTRLKTCILDDLREGITRATSRMIDQKDKSTERNMIDITYKQTTQHRSLVAILEKLYICASVEFLMAVGEFFIQSIPQSPSSDKPVQSQQKQALTKPKEEKESKEMQRMSVKALIMDPEIVFVASLTKADAPALSVSFQGTIAFSSEPQMQKMVAVVKEFKVLACPFLRELRGSNMTTVLQPCSLQLESTRDVTGAQNASLSLEEVIIKWLTMFMKYDICCGLSGADGIEQHNFKKYCTTKADFSKQPLHLISSSDKQGLDLLKLEFIKAEKNGPDFQTTFGSTEQTLKVAFSSVELLLHSQALLSAISFLTEAIPSLPDKADKSPTQEQQDRGTFVKKAAKVSKDKDVFFFKLFAKLDSFRVNVCDGDRQITEIIIQGLDSSVSIQMNQIQAFARLRDIIVNDVNPETIHKKAVSIMEDEVFNFNLTLYPDATQGEAYKDVSKVDGEVSLRVGCIQIVFLHKFLMSLLSFLNNFQATKERVSVATAQAAHRAANSVKGLSERSFRLLMDIHLKAPVIVIPQSSVSLNAIVADLGLLRIHNEFSLVASSEDQQLPPVIDKMSVQLTELKLSRTVLHSDASRSDIQILHPIDLNLSVHRNLAAAWYHQIPAMEMKGHLNTMEVGLSQEDISVLLNVLVENLGEAEGDVKIEKQIEITKSKEETLGVQKPVENIMGDYTSETTKDARDSTALNLLLNFEIKEVVVRLMRQGGLDISPFHVLHVSQLGTEARVGNHEINASVYLRKITMICNEFSGPNGGPLHLINSSDETGDHLLKMEYIKADRNGPNFKAFHKNTEQTLTVTMSTLDLILHTQALLSLIDFLSSAIPSSGEQAPKRAQEARLQTEKQKFAVTRPDSATLAEEDIFNLKLSARLNAFNVFVCDELCKIADIRIQGMDASIAVQTRQTEVFARLRDIVVIDVDPKTIHQKAVFIVGDEVFSFKMLLFPEATEGASYTDMSVVDGKISLKVGCIHIVYLHKFLMSLLNFLNKFQAAKEALSTATAQAAEKAATSMKEFAQKSFRLSMDIDLKAPVIIIPQSSTSTNAIVADLGLIQVQNKFSLVPEENCPLPPVIDEMNIQLTQLQLSRTVLQSGSELPVLELLKPVNLLVSVKRNLAASWYPQIPAMQIVGDLKPMQLALSQEDLTILMSVLFENLSELPSLPSEKQPPEVFEKVKKTTVQSDSKEMKEADRSEPMSEEDMGDDAPAVTLKFEFNFQSLSIVLYSNDNSQEAPLWQHSDSMRLGEMRLHLLTSSGRMFADGSMDVSTRLKTCILDDLREGITRATSRMIDQKDKSTERNMIDITYKQTTQHRSLVAILEKLYICASVEFLMAVGEFFIQSIPQSPSSDKPVQSQQKQALTKPKEEKESKEMQRMSVKALIMDPEIVFVASLTKADAPALSVSFQGTIAFSSEPQMQKMVAVVKEFKVLACPFLRELRGSNMTTVLQPCSLQLESTRDVTGAQNASLSLEEVIIKISPIILNTLQTIMAALKPKAKEDVSKEASNEHKNIWDVRTIDSCNSWFMGVDSTHNTTESFVSQDGLQKQENFDIEVRTVQVTLECGLGHHTVPLLLVESMFTGTVKNWSSLLHVKADTTLEVHYYNENYAAWEPLIERVDGGLRSWTLKLEIKNNPVQNRSLLPGDDFIMLPEPQSSINISSKDVMNITVSKSTLSVFSNLSKAFSEGTASTFDYSFKDSPPLTVRNALGLSVMVQHSPNVRGFGSSTHERVHEIAQGKSLDLEYSSMESVTRGKLSALHRQESNLFTLTIVPQGYTEVANIPLTKPSRRLYNVRSPLMENCVSIIAQIDAVEGNKVVTIRSPLQIKNHFSVPFTIYKFVQSAKLLEPIGVSRPDEEFHVPLDSYRCQLFLRPAGALEGQFKESTSYITWKEMLHRSSEVRCTLQCPSSEVNFLPLIVNCIAIPDEINFIANHGEKEWDPAYIIHLHPSLTIRNLLPYSLRYLLEGTADAHELAEGSTADVLHSRIAGEIMELVLIKYQGKNWNGHFRVRQELPEFFPVCFTADTSEVMTVDLTMHVKRVANRVILSVFSPYWIINKTSRVLQYRAEEIHVKHPADFRDVILFSFKKKNIFTKNKIQLCISTSAWSTGFSLDTVGSYGCVKCRSNKMEYLVGVNIKMSSFNLSRIITLTPFYTLVNKCEFELEVGEIVMDGAVSNIIWNYISSSECIPFWPENVLGKLCVRVVGCEGCSNPFYFNKQDNGTLLRLDSVKTGLIVDISISDHSIVIRFSDYYEGAAPALIVNHTPRAKLTYYQSETKEENELVPEKAGLFAWADPAGTKKLTWRYADNIGELDLLKDESGQFAYNSDIQIHWVSFLDGRQRVLLFTEDVALVTKARQAEELEQPDQELNVSIHSLGLSLINNDSKQEISYIGITSSGVVWEMKPKQKWKPFHQKQIIQLEQAYKEYLTTQVPGWTKIDNNFEVSFSKMPMVMRQPVKCCIRRNFLPGIQIEFKQSPHQRSLRAQLFWLQVDNQLPGSMFPAVFHPVAPPKSIALDSEPKPFIDISIITRFNEFSKIMQFKYFMVLIQCMALKIDQGFLAAVIGLFTPSTDPETERQRTCLIQKDLDALSTELMESSLTDISTQSFFEHFHISPLKLHLSLSLGAGGEESGKEEHEIVAIGSVNLLLKSIGATLTDVDDLIFKLACFEVKYQFYKREQLMKLVVRHYSEQFLKQMYVLLLGLDVLGNPFGLIRGLSEGVEAFFYEPFQGAVQGPEEFAEGFVIGVRSLLGHTVGGAAGVVSRITGSVGKGLAAITMDKEYQQKRREEMGRQPKDFGDSLAKGGKGFLRGVVGGVTGIITKPVEGAKREGAAGFFKGIGKGLVGVVARPTGGIIDMASSTFQGIQRAAESTEEISPLRPPRLIHEDGIIRPYNQSEAQGFNLFENSNIKKLDGEIYRYCCSLRQNRKSNLIITNRRVLCVKEVEILGHRTIDWDYSFEDFLRPPTVEENILNLFVKDQGLLVFHKKDSSIQESQKRIQLLDSLAAREVLKAIDDAQATMQQHVLVRQKSERFNQQYGC
ncbi:LOW QUALITY PROTEIN: intermembrane lipid transfer protein VPS13C [Bombina bombina]|uniref:LOW QUALITY PROTEIN: intermembrane lipid transfer protein VPS13C n=1 Tax=Bombina bombina TaxID=8345 RepID=UPI00235AA8E0|nr:LOW QUALITY PROTEIN: intermembrane lipid transfer protein VPS13C [Bombina bombina]